VMFKVDKIAIIYFSPKAYKLDKELFTIKG
jgi:hypothetical protein